MPSIPTWFWGLLIFVVIAEAFTGYGLIKHQMYLWGGSDALAPGLQVCVDDVMSPRGLRVALRPASEVHFLPAIGGG